MSARASNLGQQARERICNGQLACTATGHILGGKGSGQPCSLCDVEISPEDLEYEVEITPGQPSRTPRAQVG